MKMRSWTMGTIVSSLSMIGCGVASTESDGSFGPLAPISAVDEPGRDVSGLTLGPPNTMNSMPARGGNGGSPTSLRGGVIYAIQVNTGRLVDRISLAYYIPSNPDNRYRQGDFVGVLGPHGGSGGTFHDWEYCPTDAGAVGIQGRAANKVDAVGLLCKSLLNESIQVSLPVYGGPGGQAFYDDCGNGRLMTGVNIRTGSVVDQIQGICQDLR